MSGYRFGLMPIFALASAVLAIMSIALVLIARPAAVTEDRRIEVGQSNLMLARALAAALADRHAALVATLGVQIPVAAAGRGVPDPENLIRLNVMGLCLMDPTNGAAVRADPAFGAPCPDVYDWHDRTMLTDLAGAGDVRLGGVMTPRGAAPRLHAALSVGDKIAVATIGTAHFTALGAGLEQDLGRHAVIVDDAGRVLAHPISGWEAARADLSQVPAVMRVLGGESAVTTYRAPSIGADVLAGFAPVPGPGWGVLVARPLEVLAAPFGLSNPQVRGAAMAAVLVAIFLGALIGYVLSTRLIRLRQAVEAVSLGHTDVALPDRAGPAELSDLDGRFAAMARHVGRAHLSEHAQRVAAERSVRAHAGLLRTAGERMQTPAARILSLSRALRSSDVSPKQAKALDEVVVACRTMVGTLTDVLDLCRLETGETALADNRFDVTRQVLAIAARWQGPAQARKTDLIVRVPPDLRVDVQGDDARLRHVIASLVALTIEAPGKGPVLLTMGLDLVPEDDAAMISIDVNRPDQRLAQADATGDPLGLMVARRLVAAMGGTVRAGHLGYSVSLTLPLAGKTAVRRRCPVGSDLPNVHIVTAHPQHRQTIRSYLAAVRARVQDHATAGSALEALTAGTGDTVIYHVDPAAMTPESFRLAAAAADPSARIIVLGGSARDHDADWLDLPVDPDALFDALAKQTVPCSLPKGDILIVEPEPDRQDAIALQLEGLDLKAHFVPDVVDAILTLKLAPGFKAVMAPVAHPRLARTDANALRRATDGPDAPMLVGVVPDPAHLAWAASFDTALAWPPTVASLGQALTPPMAPPPRTSVAAAG